MEKTIYFCDMCGKEIPEVGPVLFIQDSSKNVMSEEVCDLCGECLTEIQNFIEVSKEKHNGNV